MSQHALCNLDYSCTSIEPSQAQLSAIAQMKQETVATDERSNPPCNGRGQPGPAVRGPASQQRRAAAQEHDQETNGALLRNSVPSHSRQVRGQLLGAEIIQ